MPLRPYQTAAVQAAFDYLHNRNGNGLIVLPTGTGKSMVIAEICQRAIQAYPAARIIIATHKRDLVQQNHDELRGIWPQAPAGIYSAGLKRKDKQAQILFCGIQSVYKNAYDIQRADLLLIDEAHTLSQKEESTWKRFIDDLRIINGGLRVIGLSATPYRMDSGPLVSEGGLFTDIIYEYPILEAIQEGYLCEVVPRHMVTSYNLDGVHKRNGEWIAGELERAVNIPETTRAAVEETIEYGRHGQRRKWVVFCTGIQHSEDVAACFREYGVTCEAITSRNVKDHDSIISRFKSGELQCVTNVNILTTGSNIPGIDLIAAMRSSESEGLVVQMIGRGTRPVYAPGYDLGTRDGRLEAIRTGLKPNCLLLDFAKWTERHGPIDQIKPRERNGKGAGDAPAKLCPPPCHQVHFAGVRVCHKCGYEFPFESAQLGDGSGLAVISTQIEPEWISVWAVQYSKHEKVGKQPSMRVRYTTAEGQFNEWICFEHGGRPRRKAEDWYKLRLNEEVPHSVNDALLSKYPNPKSILVKKAPKGQWPEILDYAWD